VVYQDSATQITVTPQSNGTLQLNAVSTTSACDPIDCNIGRQ
jgi:hypothetical protein